MLSLLKIENIAVIEEADIEFDPGFNVLTGETGAGKSIVIDALSAVLGERTSRDILRTGADSASVTALFSINGEELTLYRRMTADGRNICRINGEPATLAELREKGRLLVNIHGQHDSQQLLNDAYHLYYLDLFGECGESKRAYAEKYSELQSLKREISSLTIDEAEKNRRIEILTNQIDELKRAKLVPGEDRQLAERRKLLRNAGKLRDALSAAHAAISGDEDSDGAASLLYTAAREMSAIASYSPEFDELAQRIEELRYSAEDIAEILRDKLGSLDFAPDELDEVEGRLDTLHRLKRKYGETIEEMLTYLDARMKELDAIEESDDTLIKLNKKLEIVSGEAERLAAELSALRREKAGELTGRILSELKQLDMANVRFSVEFEDKPMDPEGIDSVRFLLSANAGEDLKPLSRIASGGELARIMLAMKNVLSDKDGIDTMVFDEVDSGVSGRAAQRVAEKMSQLARTRQVFCVTHLAQIAAMADTQFLVEKSERGGRTYTDVIRLDREGRRQELARLTGGENITDTMLRGADEMLRAAEKYKSGIGA